MPSKKISILLIVMMASVMAACSGLKATSTGGTGGTGGGTGVTATISVDVTGLANGASVIFQDKGGDSLTVTTNGTFSFTTAVNSYDVTVNTQPTTPNQICTVANGQGTPTTSTVTLMVSCVNSYTIGGTVTGLVGSGFALQDSDGGILENLPISATNGNQAFTFKQLVPTGSTYTVTIATQPSNPSQTCGFDPNAATSASGTATSNVTTISVTCKAVTYSVGGNVVGLQGLTSPANGPIVDNSFVLEDKLGNTIIIPQNGPFTFATTLALNDSYQVSILHDPSSQYQRCTLWGYAGTVTGNITNILVDCAHSDWGWINGVNKAGTISAPQYGLFPSSAPTSFPNPYTNTPGARYGAAGWTDPNGNLWLFGGDGWEISGSSAPDTLDAPMNDVWVCVFGDFVGNFLDYCQWHLVGAYDPATNGRSSQPTSNGAGIIFLAQHEGQPSFYGNLGLGGWYVPTPAPGGRLGVASWSDAAGNFWMFGGSDGGQFHNDMWELNSGSYASLPNPYLWTNYTSTAPLWTWRSSAIASTAQADQPGIYPPSVNAYPGARTNATTWKDNAGNFWMFGGYGYDGQSPSILGYLNDLWKFNPNTQTWTFVAGSTMANQLGNYGAAGTFAASNLPGGRQEAAGWTDANGNLWLFGGEGEDATGTANGILNDLWVYQISSGQWTYVQGFTAANQTGAYGSASIGAPNTIGAAGTVGLLPASSTTYPGSRWGASAWTDAGGDLWLFGGWGLDSTGTNGNGALNDLWVYVPNATLGQPGSWTWVKGSSTGDRGGSAATSLVRPYPYHVTDTPGGRSNATHWVDGLNQLWMFGGEGYDSSNPTTSGYVNDLWRYIPYPD